jgi:hypothetical protein
MTYQMTRQQIESLQIGDLVPNCFGQMKPITRITCKSEDIKGKFFACFYQKFGETSEMSHSVKEGESMIFVN